MIKIGITGGVGAGKSTVLNHLSKKYNAKVYLADTIAHILEEPGAACYNEIVSHFGDKILNADGFIDSKAFANIIFNDSNALETVNGIIHPAVKNYILDKITEEEEAGTKMFVLEAALLIEDGYLDILDEIWYIHTDALVRRERLKSSRGYSDEKVDSIFSKQLTDDEYRRACKYTIDNSLDEAETIRQIDLILGDNHG